MKSPRMHVRWMAGVLLVPASLAAQIRAPIHAPATKVAPNYHTQMLAFEHGLRATGSSVDAKGCKVMVLEATPAPAQAQFATGVVGTVVHYAIRAGYVSGQAAPSQQTLMAASNCVSVTPEIAVGPGGGGSVWPLGGYPRDGQMWRNCTQSPCPVYPQPTAWGPSSTFLRGGETAPFAIRVPSTPSLGRVVFRVYSVAEVQRNGTGLYVFFDSTNAVTVAY